MEEKGIHLGLIESWLWKKKDILTSLGNATFF